MEALDYKTWKDSMTFPESQGNVVAQMRTQALSFSEKCSLLKGTPILFFFFFFFFLFMATLQYMEDPGLGLESEL